MDQQVTIMRKTINKFRNHYSNSKLYKLDMETALEMENDNEHHQSYSYPRSSCMTSIPTRPYDHHRPHHHQLHQHHHSYHYISPNSISCNNHNRNRLLQISSAQSERIKNTNIESSLKNYELMKRLETLASTHFTSVPIIIKSWKYINFSSAFVYFDREYQRDLIELSSIEVSYLNEVYN